MQKKLVIWDMDATILNPNYKNTQVNKITDALGNQFPNLYNNIGTVAPDALVTSRVAKLVKEQVPGLSPTHELIAQMYEFMEHYKPVEKMNVTAFEGVGDVLKKFKDRGYIQAVASNSHERIVKYQLEHLGLAKYFDTIHGHRPKVSDHKPGSKMIERVLNDLGINRHNEIIIIGDSKADFKLRDTLRRFPYFSPVILGHSPDTVAPILKVMRSSEKDALLMNGLNNAHVSDTFGYAPTIDSLEGVVDKVFATLSQKRKNPLSNTYINKVLESYDKLLGLHANKRTKREYPDQVSCSVHFSELGNKQMRNSRIAEKGKTPEGKIVDELREQMEYAIPFVQSILAKSSIVEELANKIIASKPTKGENITLIYSFRNETKGASRKNTNTIPPVYSELLKQGIQKHLNAHAPELNLSVKVEAMMHATKNSRKQLSAFQKLAARSIFKPMNTEGKVILLDDNTVSGMSLMEMICALSPKADVLDINVMCLYDGTQQLRIHPTVKDELVTAIHKNTGDDSSKPVDLFEKILKKIGHEEGLGSLTNMEALAILTRLYDYDKGLEIIERIWPEFNDHSFTETNKHIRQVGQEVWPGLVPSSRIEPDPHETGDQTIDHMVLRSLRRPVLNFYDELDGLVAFASQRGEQMLSDVDKSRSNAR